MTPLHNIDIDRVLPQQPPFRFVDTLEAFSEEGACVSFTPGPGNMLMEEDGCLSACGLMEHMAQANAARVGYLYVYILHLPVKIGFIGQVRNYVIHRLPRSGERLDTTVQLRYEMFGVSLCDVTVCSGQEVLATASLKTAIKDD